MNKLCLIVVACAVLGSVAQAQEHSQKNAGRDKESVPETIIKQPVEDVGIIKRDVSPLLADAAAAPYSLRGLRTCSQIASAVGALNEELGPDFSDTGEAGSKGKRLVTAGGQALINSVVPFRGLVREVSGAASAERRYERAVAAAIARRGFLRGVHQTRHCRGPL